MPTMKFQLKDVSIEKRYFSLRDEEVQKRIRWYEARGWRVSLNLPDGKGKTVLGVERSSGQASLSVQ